MLSYTISEVKNIIHVLTNIFDIARIVDPVRLQVITFTPDNQLIYSPYNCFHVWKKTSRCKNCVSMQAYYQNTRITKYEFVNHDIYYIVSLPINLINYSDSDHNCVIEIVSKITNEVIFGASGQNELVERIISSEKKIYQDSLTQVYNRRYFDERKFCHNQHCELSNDVVFILMDLKKFKLVNDTYGHDTGDWVLRKTAQTIRKNVRREDSVIRMGGDEFLIVLNHCSVKIAKRIIAKIQDDLKQNVVYDSEHDRYVVANCGISYTDHFLSSKEFIEEMLKEADAQMYEDKNNNQQ